MNILLQFIFSLRDIKIHFYHIKNTHLFVWNFFWLNLPRSCQPFPSQAPNLDGRVSKYILVSGRARSSALLRTFIIFPVILECLRFWENLNIVLLSLEYPISFFEQPVVITYPTSWGFSFFRDGNGNAPDWAQQAQRREWHGDLNRGGLSNSPRNEL